MSDWRGQFHPERHVPGAGSSDCAWCWVCYSDDGKSGECWQGYPCRCCTNAENKALRATVQRVRAVPEKDRRLWFTDDRHPLTLDYIDGWNDALDYVEQALDGDGDE